ncbi:MAG: hypothetical protein ACOCRO_07180 [Halanaerobiales bacterium]
METVNKPELFSSLEEIFEYHGISLRNDAGEIRNAVDVIEDMYLKLNPYEFGFIVDKISRTEQRVGHIFDKERQRQYKE